MNEGVKESCPLSPGPFNIAHKRKLLRIGQKNTLQA
jgi:hypothetical protein